LRNPSPQPFRFALWMSIRLEKKSDSTRKSHWKKDCPIRSIGLRPTVDRTSQRLTH